MSKFIVWTAAFVAGCYAASSVEAGNCHGTKKAQVEQKVEVTEAPASVSVTEEVTVTGNPANVTVVEEVIVGEPGPAKGPVGVHATRKDARKVKRAMIAEAKADRAAGRAARKEANAVHESEAAAAVKRAYSN